MTRPELSYDGFGINGPDEYRTRIATFSRNEEHRANRDKYGPLFEAAPELLAALERILYAHDTKNNGAAMGEAVLCSHYADMARASIARAKGAK